MKVFKPSLQRALGRWLMIALLMIFIIMPLVYLRQHFKPGHADDDMSWGFTVAAIGFMAIIFILESKVRSVTIDKAQGIISIRHIKYFRTAFRTFIIVDTEISFTKIPSARGGSTEVLRFKDKESSFDIPYGFNGWGREVLEQVRIETLA